MALPPLCLSPPPHHAQTPTRTDLPFSGPCLNCPAEVEEGGTALQNWLHPYNNHCNGECHGESEIRSPNVLEQGGQCGEELCIHAGIK